MTSLSLNHRQLLFFILLLESIVLFLFAPDRFVFGFNLLCAIQFIVSAVIYINVQKKRNFFDFDLIFLLTYFFIMFFFPVFMYGTDLENVFFAFQYDYNHNVISRATALSLLGAQAFMFGGLIAHYRKIRSVMVSATQVIPNGVLTWGIVVCFVLLIVAGGPELFTHKYDGKLGGESAGRAIFYFLVLFGSLLIAAFVIEFNNWSNDEKYRKNCWLFIILVLFSVVFVLIGSRGSVLQFALLVIGLYGLKIKAVNFKMMTFLVVGGILTMGLLGLMRTKDETVITNMREEAGALVYIQDLVLNNRNTFMAVDMVDKKGIDYGLGMMESLLGVIPFANSLIINITPLTSLDLSSGLRITAESLGMTSDLTVGFGTNIIASIYMSFGMIGVIIMMYLLGWMIKYIEQKVCCQNSIYYLLFYGVMMSYSVYIVRAEYFVFLRYLVWGLIIININKLHPVRIKVGFKSYGKIEKQ